MANIIQTLMYKGHDIHFDLRASNIMVNATEMSRPFQKKVNDFLRLSTTTALISAIQERYNLQKKEIVHTSTNGGTWMNRKLAIEFAAWLNPDFRLWILDVIERLLFSDFKEIQSTLQTKAEIKGKLRELFTELSGESEKFREFILLQTKDRQLSYQLGKTNQRQLQLLMA